MSVTVKRVPFWKRVFLSEWMLRKSFSQKIAYVGMMTALLIVANMVLEFKFAEIQFSFTVFLSMLSGIVVGPVCGFFAAFLGDAIGFLYHSGGFVYMPWVGLSVATMALLAGLTMNLPFSFRGSCYVKLTIACLLAFVLCTSLISTLGFYYYFRAIGFSEKSLAFVEETFGVEINFFTYLIYRLLTGQLYINLVNYALLFCAVPLLNAIKPLKLNIR